LPSSHNEKSHLKCYDLWCVKNKVTTTQNLFIVQKLCMKCQVLHWFQPIDVQKNINMNTSRKKKLLKIISTCAKNVLMSLGKTKTLFNLMIWKDKYEKVPT